MAIKRKTKTAMVHNPTRRLTVGGGLSKSNPPRKRRRKTTARRRNPVQATASRRRRNPARVNNPATLGGLAVASVMAGFGVTVFDVIASRVAPSSSAMVRTGVKLGGAYLFQTFGQKLPLLGKYHKDIALVLGVAGVVDLIKLYVFPMVTSGLSNFGLVGTAPVAEITDGTTGNIYGNAYSPSYQVYS